MAQWAKKYDRVHTDNISPHTSLRHMDSGRGGREDDGSGDPNNARGPIVTNSKAACKRALVD